MRKKEFEVYPKRSSKGVRCHDNRSVSTQSEFDSNSKIALRETICKKLKSVPPLCGAVWIQLNFSKPWLIFVWWTLSKNFLKLYKSKKLANNFTLIVHHIGAEQIVKRENERSRAIALQFGQTLSLALQNHNLWSCRPFIEEFDGESPRSKLEQERGQTDGRKWLKDLEWRKRDRNYSTGASRQELEAVEWSWARFLDDGRSPTMRALDLYQAAPFFVASAQWELHQTSRTAQHVVKRLTLSVFLQALARRPGVLTALKTSTLLYNKEKKVQQPASIHWMQAFFWGWIQSI